MVDEIEDDLARLEQLMKKLESEYDQFFSGLVRGLPNRTEKAVQTLIRDHGRRAIQNPGLRFRYANLVARYNSYRTIWGRRIREQEEGRVVGRPSRGSSPQRVREAAAAGQHAGTRSFVSAGSLGRKEPMEEIFHSYKELRKKCGESTERLKLENFSRVLVEKIEKVRSGKNCEKVEIRLRRDNGKCRILLRPCREDD